MAPWEFADPIGKRLVGSRQIQWASATGTRLHQAQVLLLAVLKHQTRLRP